MGTPKNQRTRSESEIWLVGGTEETFKSSKLPSRGEVLKVLFHFREFKELSLKDSIDMTRDLLLPIWNRARIPTKAPNHVVEHIKKLHSRWQGLKKLINRTSEKNLSDQRIFQESLNDLFDVAHRDAMSLITIDEDRQFLKAQREKGRKGIIAGLDQSLSRLEKRVHERKLDAEKRVLKAQSEARAATETAILDDSSSESDTGLTGCHTQVVPQKPKMRGTKCLVNSDVAAALDRTNTSNRKAAHIFSAMASTSQLATPVEDSIISTSAIRRARIKHREASAKEIKNSFDPTVPLVLHWDGKMMDDFSTPGSQQVERLPISVSGENVEKLLAVPKLNDSTAVTISSGVWETIREWKLQDLIQGLCFDTTSVNTGLKGGACKLLEQEFDRELLNLACRHHVAEIMLEKVFSLHDVSKSPNLDIFRHFRDLWPKLDLSSYSTAQDDEETSAVIAPWKDDVVKFSLDQLETFQPREDYRELLELTIIFLGTIPPRGVCFRYPGPIHRSRWMARAIYALKMWLFRNQYNLLNDETKGSRKTRGLSLNDKLWIHLKEVCLFITEIYIKYWFQSPSSTQAPRNDLALLCSLSQYRSKEVANAAINAFSNHLWYLSEILVGFSFFDEQVPTEEKRCLVQSLKQRNGSDRPLKRIPAVLDPTQKGLHDFVTTSTMRFFKILRLSEEFLTHDPSEWETLESYQSNHAVVRSVRVVNDLAERGVALMQEFNHSLTRNEEQQQFVLQVIENHRAMFAEPTKAAAIKRSRLK